jgi:hypothetical protein
MSSPVHGELTIRVRVARNALRETENPELAWVIGQNLVGDPILIYPEGHTKEERNLMHRAIRLGHLADPEGAPVVCPREELILPLPRISKCFDCLFPNHCPEEI